MCVLCVCVCVIHEASQVLPFLPEKEGSCFLIVCVFLVCGGGCGCVHVVSVCGCVHVVWVWVYIYQDINPTPISMWWQGQRYCLLGLLHCMQQLMLPPPSPFAQPFTENLHISQVCSYVVHTEQRVRYLSDWVLGVCVCVCICMWGGGSCHATSSW